MLWEILLLLLLLICKFYCFCQNFWNLFVIHVHITEKREDRETIKLEPSYPSCHLYHNFFLTRTRNTSFKSAQLHVCVCFLSNTPNPAVHHNSIVFFYQPVNSRETERMKNRTDRPLSFQVSVDGVSKGCHACPHPQPCLTLSAHHFIIYLSKCLTLLFGLQLVCPRLTCSITFTFTFSVEMSPHFSHTERQCQISLSLCLSHSLLEMYCRCLSMGNVSSGHFCQ